jgi:glucosamine-6-phosphate deaminase
MNQEFKIDLLTISMEDDRSLMGAAAASRVVAKISQLLDTQEQVNMIFAAAPSQQELLIHLSESPNLDWGRVNAFHMDEWLGLSKEAHTSFGYFLHQRIFRRCPFRSVNYLNGDTTQPLSECRRYELLLKTHPIDIVCLGIGENGHIAFNDPHVADFSDPDWVKLVDLDQDSRMQQVHDGGFIHIGQVPFQALTLTIPALLSGRYLYCVVPGRTKARAVFNTLYQKVDKQFPSTILRRHPEANLFLDKESGSLLTL